MASSVRIQAYTSKTRVSTQRKLFDFGMQSVQFSDVQWMRTGSILLKNVSKESLEERAQTLLHKESYSIAMNIVDSNKIINVNEYNY